MIWHYSSDEDDPPSSVNTNLAHTRTGLLTIEHREKNLVHHSMPVRVEASSKNIRHEAPIEWFD
jgi:hypothetical protein